MTHPDSTRTEALRRTTAGESARAVALSMGIDPRTVQRWDEERKAAMSQIAAPVAERIHADAALIMVLGLTTLGEQIQMARVSPEYMRDTAYATKVASDIALDWRDGRKGATGVVVDNSQHLHLPAGMTPEEALLLARRGTAQR